MHNLAIFASHNGTAFTSINKESNINVSLIISNNTNANILQKAKDSNIPNFVVNDNVCENSDERIIELLEEYNCSYIFLAGYMKKISPTLSKKYKIINSHPALLPNYGGKGMYGRFVHEAVIKNNESQSGVTIHEVNENYDEGAIILQQKVLLEENETVESLENKIKQLEQKTIIEALKICLK